ncbi:restriction endonuclease subunit S [Vibrio cholerae]|uniref:restriction endonuclease subunit S n=1 Tax=Vibrio cholerae TaxID=666 RepID=UPI0022F33093|nr:restriction endonuclease subunit S [Vibrio cholerae]EIY4752555.1 restriction endonuclease subunit S [Vibrio cholerae]EJL6675687.1 restriction endonuclease subunit S [Vibrio cholerae]MDA5315313.1 restriction endonuclease subunit S [Vibrio cholerae]MDN6971377.1 restriction endonuclease subunit S [Vibrio cholerae]
MGSDAKFVQLGSLCSQVLTGGTPLTKNKHFYDGGTIPWLKTKEVNFNFIESTENYITEAGLAGSSAKLVPVNSVIVAMYGQGDTAGRVAVNKIPVTTNQACCNLVIDPLKADYRFVYYYLKSSYSELVRRKTGSAQPNLNTKILKDFEIVDLPLARQTAIGDQLEALDQKIILNRQINQTLEQMAQTLFKSWFVDFDPVIDNALDAGNPIPDELQHRAEVRKAVRESEGFKPLPDEVRQLFPDAFEESELGWVPKGWEVKKISDFGSVICGKTPSKKIPEYYGSDVPFLKIPDMHGNVFVVKTTDKLSYKGSNSQVKKLIPKDSISVSCIATVGLVSISTEPMHTNQQINSIVPNQPRFRDYLYFSMKEKRKQFHDLASGGSTTLNMNTGVFSRVSVLKPSDAILDMFQTQSSGLLERIKLSSTESESLAALRDTLLPKLISGELRLDDIELAVEQEAVSAEQQNER